MTTKTNTPNSGIRMARKVMGLSPQRREAASEAIASALMAPDSKGRPWEGLADTLHVLQLAAIAIGDSPRPVTTSSSASDILQAWTGDSVVLFQRLADVNDAVGPLLATIEGELAACGFRASRSAA